VKAKLSEGPLQIFESWGKKAKYQCKSIM
jgi:hypothetical protein